MAHLVLAILAAPTLSPTERSVSIDLGAAGDGPVRRTSRAWQIEADGRTADGRGIPAAMFLVLRVPGWLEAA